MITAVIIDDEEKSVLMLGIFIRDYCPQVKILGSAGSAAEGKELIERVQPQLVFLDVEMPYGNGFDLLQSFTEINFEVIFITAFNQYALKAFRFSALDYLLKPLNIEQLQEAVERVEKNILYKESTEKYSVLLQNLNQKNTLKQKISVRDKKMQYFVPMEDIMYCIADGSYTQIYLQGKTFMSSRKLKDFEDMLPADSFCRIHHGHIVNLKYIAKLPEARGGKVIMRDGKVLEIAVRRKEEFIKLLSLQNPY